MKRIGISLLLLVSIFSGCGKKKHSDDIVKSKSVPGVQGRLDEYVFDDTGKVKNFSFVDTDGKNSGYATEQGISDDLNSETLAFSSYKDEDEDLGFNRINFSFNTDKLTSGQQEILHKNIEKARQVVNKNRNVEVRAYGCEMGSADYNIALSQKRANVIKREMIGHGIPEKKINAVGKGQEYQIAWSNSNNRETRIKELAPNRRAEISALPA